MNSIQKGQFVTRNTWVIKLAITFVALLPSICYAAPSLFTPTATNVGAGMATLVLQSNETGTGYFILLAGSNTPCGTGTQVAAGQDSNGVAAPYVGSLPLTADVAGSYTLQNLMQSSAYTICFTADSPSGSNLNSAPVSTSFSTTTSTAFNFPSWSTVGSAGFSAGQAISTSLAFAPDGTPYVAYSDQGNGGKAAVMKFSNGVWSAVGSAGLSTGPAFYNALAFAPDGTPYVAFEESNNANKATVMKYSGGAWSVVGSAGFSAENAYQISLAFSPDGTPYVGYWDGNASNKIIVMKHSSGGWSSVGSAGFVAQNAETTSMALSSDGTPYVAYRDKASLKATVMKYSGGAWVAVGSSASFGVVNGPSLKFAPDGTLYLAYGDGTKGNKTTVTMFNGGDWSVVGSAGFTAAAGYSPKLALSPDGAPFVLSTDGSNSGMASVMKYSNGVWVSVGSDKFSTASPSSISLALSPDGTPFLSYDDATNVKKATVMKLTNLPLAISGSPVTSAVVDTPYNFTPAAENAVIFSISGDLPPGISFSSATGSLSGAPTTAGTYHDIVITATNGIDFVSLPAFTISVVAPGFGLNVSVSGSGTVHSSTTPATADINCSGSCNQSFDSGTLVTLTPTPNGTSIFSGWSNCPLISGEFCMVTMNMAKSLTATFSPLVDVVLKVGNTSYGTIAEASSAVTSGGELSLKVGDIYESLNFNRAITFTVKGGYSSDFQTQSATTTINGSITITAGTVILDGIAIK